eukprot:426592_1
MAQRVVTWEEFQTVFVDTHPELTNRNHLAQQEWTSIKIATVPDPNKTKWKKKIPSKHWPSSFHIMCGRQMDEWKTEYLNKRAQLKARLATKRANFFKLKPKRRADPPTDPPKLKRRRVSTAPPVSVDHITECIEMVKQFTEISSKWFMFCESIEWSQYVKIINSSEFRQYVKRTNSFAVHDTSIWTQMRSLSFFKQLSRYQSMKQKILAFGETHEFKMLSQCIHSMSIKMNSRIIAAIRAQKSVSKLEQCLAFIPLRGLLKCYAIINFHALRPNYVDPEKKRVSQTDVISAIDDVDVLLANCVYLPADKAAKSIETLKKRKDKLHKQQRKRAVGAVMMTSSYGQGEDVPTQRMLIKRRVVMKRAVHQMMIFHSKHETKQSDDNMI